MAHTLDSHRFTLPAIDDFFAGDSRRLAFEVLDGDTPIDLSDADIEWALFEREYQTQSADAVLDETDAAVEIVTDSRVDVEAGEFEVRLDAEATDGLWGEFYHRPRIEAAETTAQWRGVIAIEA